MFAQPAFQFVVVAIFWGQLSIVVVIADDPVDVAMSQRPNVWDVLRGNQSQDFGVMTVLHGMAQRLDAAIKDGNQKAVHEDGVELKLGVHMDEPTDQEIYIGFFTDAEWAAAKPAFVRTVPGSGIHTLKGIKPGSYYLGAMIGRYPNPEAVGVCQSWPEPVIVSDSAPCRGRLLLGPKFRWQPDLLGVMDRQDKQTASDDSLLVQTVDQHGKTVPCCTVGISFVDRSELEDVQAVPPADDNGPADSDVVLRSFLQPQLSVVVAQHEILPESMTVRGQIWRESYHPPGDAPLTIVVPKIPVGTGTVCGRVCDQHQKPVTQFNVFLYQVEPDGVKPLRGRPFHATLIRMPVTSEDGRFSCSNLAPGDYMIHIHVWDRDLYRNGGPETKVTIGNEPDAAAQVEIEVKVRQSYFGMLVNPDGRAVPNVTVTCKEKNGSTSSTIANPFRWIMSTTDQQELIQWAAGQIRIADAEDSSRFVTIDFRDLSTNEEDPSVLRLPPTQY